MFLLYDQADGFIAPSVECIFCKTVDNRIAFNRAILKYESLELTSNLDPKWMFPELKMSVNKRRNKKSERVSSVKAIEQIPLLQDDLKLITVVDSELEKKLQNVGITSLV